MSARTQTIWTFVITSVALFMVTLDNLVVTMALPSIRLDLGASIEDLEWTVNAYTLTFAVLLLTGAALGDRFGRRRLFVIGLGIFTVASAAAALAPNVETLIAARAVQGLGGAIVTPLTLTILSAAVPPAKRGLALGAWGGIGGLGVALGPVIGGAVVEGLSWQWIFWLNVPIGLVLVPLAWNRLKESYGPDSRLDLPGLGLASIGEAEPLDHVDGRRAGEAGCHQGGVEHRCLVELQARQRRRRTEQLGGDVHDAPEEGLLVLELGLPPRHAVEGRARELARGPLDVAQVARQRPELLVRAWILTLADGELR